MDAGGLSNALDVVGQALELAEAEEQRRLAFDAEREMDRRVLGGGDERGGGGGGGEGANGTAGR